MVRVLSRATEFELFVLERHVLVRPALVAFDLVILVDRIPSLRIDKAALDPIAGGPIQGVKADLLAVGDRRHHGDRAGHQRELQVALPK